MKEDTELIEMARKIGQFLKNFREKKGLTLQEVADRSALYVPYLSQLEGGKRGVPTLKTINRLASAYNLPRTELLIILEKVIGSGSTSMEKYGSFDPVGDRLKKIIREYQKMSPEDQDDVWHYVRRRIINPIRPPRKVKAE